MAGDIREGAEEGKRKARPGRRNPIPGAVLARLVPAIRAASAPYRPKIWKTLQLQISAKRREKLAKHFKNGSEREPSFSKDFLGDIILYIPNPII
jgi:hypothetical protein